MLGMKTGPYSAFMKHSRLALAFAGALSLPGGLARAQVEEPVAPSLPSGDDPGGERGNELERELEELRTRLRELDAARAEQAVSPLSINGYLDLGFFAPNGNGGAGWIRDDANERLPQYSQYAWTFLGDILATTINTRGDVADLGNERAPNEVAPDILRYDAVDSDGAPGFIANELNLRLGYQLAERALLRTSVNFAPRSAREEFALGDTVDVDLAELEYLLTADGKTSFFVGKTLPVFGIEYKERKSDQRFGITPSLLHRYTSGPQLGAKVRSKLLSDWVILAASVTNNSSTTEQFHFYNEIDRNSGKTLNGRAAVSVPLGSLIGFLEGERLEVGVSGEWGPQDRATDNDGKTKFWGVDVQYLGANVVLKAQGMRGESAGSRSERVWGLELKNSGYVEANVLVFPWLGVLGRAEARDALVTLAQGDRLLRAYVTKSIRYTGGLRVIFNPRVVLKAEYLHNREFGDVPNFKNDIFTSSLVLSF